MSKPYYLVTFHQSGIGTPTYHTSREELTRAINSNLDAGTPFRVGHEFRGTLSDGLPDDMRIDGVQVNPSK